MKPLRVSPSPTRLWCNDPADFFANGKSTEYTPERALWCAVIEQALADLQKPNEANAAAGWIFTSSPEVGSFDYACAVCGINANAVRAFLGQGHRPAKRRARYGGGSEPHRQIVPLRKGVAKSRRLR